MIPDAEESRRFCSDIWNQAVTQRENIDWLRKVENQLGELTVQDDIHIEIKKVRKYSQVPYNRGGGGGGGLE